MTRQKIFERMRRKAEKKGYILNPKFTDDDMKEGIRLTVKRIFYEVEELDTKDRAYFGVEYLKLKKKWLK